MSFLPLLSTALGFLPGAGSLLSAGVSTIGGMMQEDKAKKDAIQKDKQAGSVNYTEQLTNVYKFGGEVSSTDNGTNEFKQYNFPSHAKGGGKIDINGNPSWLGSSELEKNENAFKLDNGNWFIFSDHLKFK